MPSTLNAPYSGSSRFVRRERYGNFRGALNAAIRERHAGNVHNAWALFREALALLLRDRLAAHVGEDLEAHNASPSKMAHKLHRANRLDKWTMHFILLADERPRPIGWRHVEVLEALVMALAVERRAADGGPVDA